MSTTELDSNKLQKYLDKLIDSETLSVHFGENEVCYIPYMMNDAVECFIKMEGCRLCGTFALGKAIVDASAVTDDKKDTGIILNYEDGKILTIWGKRAELCTAYYRFHKLGHFWRQGEDQWRRLNYIIGTIYDKYLYLEKDSCNILEQRIMKLLGFTPFRQFSPIDEAFDIFYTEESLSVIERDGIVLFMELSGTSGCDKLENLTRKYLALYDKCLEAKHFNRKKLVGIEKKIFEEMMREASWPVYKSILDILEDAMKGYEDRKYSAEWEKQFDEKRQKIHRMLIQDGYEGEYPLYKRQDGMAAHAIEEHPYTIQEMEYDGFQFDIHVMVWKCPSYPDRLHGGFFKGRENYCEIKTFS